MLTITSSPVAHADVALISELDEQWAFVGSKAVKHWLWYAYNTKKGGVLAYTFGPRNDETCRELLALLTPFSIGMVTSDDWGSHAREVPKEKHLTGKIFTQRIERNNLTLRTRHAKQFVFRAPSSSAKKSSVPSLRSTCSTNWRSLLLNPAGITPSVNTT
ncbi:Mobile element protein [Pectobacterium sp. F1-1]|nr:Mobile element protein [Pectobacterium sp. F1-1]